MDHTQHAEKSRDADDVEPDTINRWFEVYIYIFIIQYNFQKILLRADSMYRAGISIICG